MEAKDTDCPYCGSTVHVKFPCCGHLCLRCGKTYDEQDIDKMGKSNVPIMPRRDTKI
jgi:DNA-directed RNA polymerase subunit RPC12/RpoP